jgi:DNA-binding protein HU-beta
MATINKKTFIEKFSTNNGISKADAEKLISSFSSLISELIKDGNKVQVPGVGVFVIKDKKARIARNPKTGEKVNVPAKRVVKVSKIEVEIL